MVYDSNEQDASIDRRRILQILGTATAAGLAGCAEDDDSGAAEDDGVDDDSEDDEEQQVDQLGERVSPITISYWSNLPLTDEKERILTILVENFEALGLQSEPQPTEFSSEISERAQGKHNRHLTLQYVTPNPARLDPTPRLEASHIRDIGSAGALNNAYYASCEYTDLVYRQSTAPDIETREELVKQAQRKLSEDVVLIPIAPVMNFSAVRTDQIEPRRIGEAGIINHNIPFYIYSTPLEGNTLIADTRTITVETKNYLILASTPALSLWNHLVQSTLLEYDENWELNDMLAEEYSIQEDGREVVVELREDAYFHNEDPITAEDVKFTFDLLWSNPGSFPQADPVPAESIEVVDDETVIFHLEVPYPPLVFSQFPMWGILHKDTWIEAEDDPDGFEPDEVIGSGPFELEVFSRGELLDLSPADTHPVHDPENELVLRAFRDESSKIEAFRAGEVSTALNIPMEVYTDFEQEGGDDIQVVAAEGFHPFMIYPVHSIAPSKFLEFRQAIGKAIDRQLINEVVFQGEAYEVLDATQFLRTHPWAPEEGEVYRFTDDPSGDIEGARDLLEEHGWGWDDDGELRYPADYDLEPLWPDEGTPDPDDFECVDEEFNYIPPDQR